VVPILLPTAVSTAEPTVKPTAVPTSGPTAEQTAVPMFVPSLPPIFFTQSFSTATGLAVPMTLTPTLMEQGIFYIYLDSTVEDLRLTDLNNLRNELTAMVSEATPYKIHIDVYPGSTVIRVAILSNERTDVDVQSTVQKIESRFRARDISLELARFPIVAISDTEGYLTEFFDTGTLIAV
jgi:hypothetical protein